MSITAKTHQAVKKFLEGHDQYILTESDIFDFIAIEDDTLVFTDVYIKDTLGNDPEMDDDKLCKDIVKALLKLDEIPIMDVRYDVVTVVPMGDRALLRRHVNARRSE